jgi:serine/threonine-protein kinase
MPPADRYILERELGRGGMGIVWIARDVVLERRVAVKELVVPPASASDFVTRFRKEARALAKLTHPNIVQVHDFLEAGDRLQMVIELAEGGSLADRLAKQGAMPAAEAAHVLADVARGLAFAHAEGVVHRDVKPQNILFSRDGIPKIADFGLAKLASDPGMTMTGSVLGSPAYLSPEQAAGSEADERSDIYSLGVTLYEALAGRPPFQGEVVALLARHLHEEPTPVHESNPDVPVGLAQLVSAMMRKNPAARPRLDEALAVLETEAARAAG